MSLCIIGDGGHLYHGKLQWSAVIILDSCFDENYI